MSAPAHVSFGKGAGWLAKNLASRDRAPASDLGQTVANILDFAWDGIYHVGERALFHPRVEWANDAVIILVIYGELATHDGRRLTDLVFAAHDASLRLAIRGSARGYLELQFTCAPLFWGRVPTPAESLQRFRESRKAFVAVPAPVTRAADGVQPNAGDE